MDPNRRRSLSTPASFLIVFYAAAFFFFFLFSSSAAATFGATDGRFEVDTVSFAEGFRPLFGDGNCAPTEDGQGVNLHLDRYTGSGFIASDMYHYGFYSAKIKLPSDYTAGVVVAFYTSNGDVFEKTHDELDIEFLGNIRSRKWRFQTNVYGNGSTARGREERYTLWFDPTADFHRYSILWTPENVIFYVDEVPIREIKKTEAMGSDYPSKPMSLYATIWDASDWATSGGRFKVNYKYAPFIAKFKDLSLDGCPIDPNFLQSSAASADFDSICSSAAYRLQSKPYAALTPGRRAAMRRFRQRYMYYYYCYDSVRYPVAMPECVVDPDERARYHDTGRLKFGGSHSKRRSRRGSSSSSPSPADYESIESSDNNQDDAM